MAFIDPNDENPVYEIESIEIRIEDVNSGEAYICTQRHDRGDCGFIMTDEPPTSLPDEIEKTIGNLWELVFNPKPPVSTPSAAAAAAAAAEIPMEFINSNDENPVYEIESIEIRIEDINSGEGYICTQRYDRGDCGFIMTDEPPTPLPEEIEKTIGNLWVMVFNPKLP